jgi:hypothetical protein
MVHDGLFEQSMANLLPVISAWDVFVKGGFNQSTMPIGDVASVCDHAH